MENDSGDAHRVIPKHSFAQSIHDFPPQNASRCEPVNVGVYGCFRGDLTQFLHSSERHLFAYAVMSWYASRTISGAFLLKRSGLNARATQASCAVIPVHFFRRKRVAGTRTGEWATKSEALHYHTGEEAEIEDPKYQVPPSDCAPAEDFHEYKIPSGTWPSMTATRPGLYQVFNLELMMTPWTIT